MESRIIDVAIGLALAFMVVSVLVSAVQEYIAGLLDMRSKKLEEGIKCLLFGVTDPEGSAEKDFIAELFKHPLLFNLSKSLPTDKVLLPSYLPAENFARALIDTSAKQLQGAGRTINDARDLIAAMNTSPCNEFLAPLLAEASGDLNHFRSQLETQYDHMMDRVSGWYKRHAQWCMLAYGFLIAVLLNVDALQLTHRLWADPVARAAVVTSVNTLPSPIPLQHSIEKEVSVGASLARDSKEQSHAGSAPTIAEPSDNSQISDTKRIEAAIANLDISKLPIGWPTKWYAEKKNSIPPVNCYWEFSKSLLGWLITALAASLGAPFWFDAIGKLVRLKGAGATPARSTATPSSKQKPTPPSAPLAPETIVNRNALVALHAERNQSDESYRPVQAEERW